MIGSIDLSAPDWAILQRVLADHLPARAKVLAFGSRVTGGARRYSDLDLAVQADAPLDPDRLAWLRTALSESDLTIKVDIVDLSAIDPAFRRLIERSMVKLPRSR